MRALALHGYAASLLLAQLLAVVTWWLSFKQTQTLLPWLLATYLFSESLALTAIRSRLSRSPTGKGHIAELEVGGLLLAALGSAAMVGFLGRDLSNQPVGYMGKVTALLCVASAFVFVFRGGTYVVRSVLDRAGVVVKEASELNRGRSIGNVERFLMVIVISLGRYEVLGFVVAAKGLIRSRDFEQRDLAEYFILGSLVSAAVALLAGIVVRTVVPYFWSL